MSKESPLSHHEQLRYDYLFKNIHYLNDREKREFDYLKRKMDGELPSNEREFHSIPIKVARIDIRNFLLFQK